VPPSPFLRTDDLGSSFSQRYINGWPTGYFLAGRQICSWESGFDRGQVGRQGGAILGVSAALGISRAWSMVSVM
jgi:hypothetical protein